MMARGIKVNKGGISHKNSRVQFAEEFPLSARVSVPSLLIKKSRSGREVVQVNNELDCERGRVYNVSSLQTAKFKIESL